MKFNRLIATLLALLLLIAFSACENNKLSSMHPNIAQSGTSASVELSVPANIKIDSAGETAKLYELTIDEAAAISQIERCLGVDLSTAEKALMSSAPFIPFRIIRLRSTMTATGFMR